MNTIGYIVAGIVAISAVAWAFRDKVRARPIPDVLQPGKTLPEFVAVDENGEPMKSTSLYGRPAVLLFVRGSWCPFCSKQVANLTHFYKEITDCGARLILITPRPLNTTRRVADIFNVRFEFWLDESLHIAKRLGLALEGGVPDKARSEYGEDTLWPTSLVVDADGVIRYTELSRFVADRPNPEKLLAMVSKLPQ